jgi:hypothetical protein
MEAHSEEDTSCYDEYTILEYNGKRRQIKALAAVTIPAAPATGVILLSAKDKFVSNAFVLPQVGNTIVLPPSGELAVVTAVTGTTSITVRLKNPLALAQVIPINAEMLVLAGHDLVDCECPTGQLTFDVAPVEHDLKMVQFGTGGKLCGKTLANCNHLKISLKDANGNDVNNYMMTDFQQTEINRLEFRKHYETLLNKDFGIIPTLRARGLNFAPALTTEITLDDVREWVKLLDQNGVKCKEYAIFAGTSMYSQWQRLLGVLGNTYMLNYAERPLNDCAWINLEYCGIKVEGLTLHIYKDCTFSNGQLLGGVGYNFPNSAIWFPMSSKSTSTIRSSKEMGRDSGYNGKLFTRVYYKETGKMNRVHNMIAEESGIISEQYGGRNHYGPGCDEQSYSFKTKFLNELHCVSDWGFTGL